MKVRTVRFGLASSILVALVSILWLVINIFSDNNGSRVINIALIILAITLVLFNYRNYLKANNIKEGILLKFSFSIGLLLSLIIGLIVLYFGISVIQEKLYIKGEYLTYLIKTPYSYLLFLIFAIVTSRIGEMNIRFSKTVNETKDELPWKKIDKYIAVLVVVLLYFLITSVVVVTKDGIYDYSFFNIKGTKYNFSDVEHVNTGFINSGKNKGEFFYNVELKNGKKLKLAYPSMPQPSEKYTSDSWQEYVDIDKYIMNSGAKKSSSEEGSSYVEMDKVYVDKLLEVVRNK